MTIEKLAFADLRSRYPLHIEVGFILALALLVLAFRLDWAPRGDVDLKPPPEELITIDEIQPTDPKETPPPPPKPRVPIAVPDEQVLEEDEIDFGAELERGNQITELPPPPVEPSDDASEPEPFHAVEEKPEPIGGMQAIYERAQDYPQMAVKAGVEGRVFVEFVVDEDGRVREAKVVRGVGAGLDELALKAIEDTRFKPGKQRGKPVPVKMSLSIRFKLN